MSSPVQPVKSGAEPLAVAAAAFLAILRDMGSPVGAWGKTSQLGGGWSDRMSLMTGVSCEMLIDSHADLTLAALALGDPRSSFIIIHQGQLANCVTQFPNHFFIIIIHYY